MSHYHPCDNKACEWIGSDPAKAERDRIVAWLKNREPVATWEFSPPDFDTPEKYAIDIERGAHLEDK